MLCLSRKEDQAVSLSNGVRVVVLRIGRGQVSLGIEAPSNVKIWRDEIMQKYTDPIDYDPEEFENPKRDGSINP